MPLNIFICALIISLVGAALGALRPILIADLLVGQSTSDIVQGFLDLIEIYPSPLLILIFLELLDFIFLAVLGVLVAHLASEVGRKYRYKLIDTAVKNIALPSDAYLSRHVGFLKTYVDTIETYFRHSLIPALSSAGQLLIAFCITFSINMNIAIILGFEIMALSLVTLFYAPYHGRLTKRHMRADERMLANNFLNSRKGFSIWFGGISSVWNSARITEIDEVAKSRRLAWFSESIYFSVNTALAGFFVIVGYGVLIELGKGSMRDFAALLMYCGLMLAPVMKLAVAYPEYKEYAYARNEINSFIKNFNASADPVSKISEIEFNANIKTSFSKNIRQNFSIRQGSRIAFVGSSGTGKTSALLGLLGAHSDAVEELLIAKKPIDLVRYALPDLGFRYISDTPVFESGTVLKNCNHSLGLCVNISESFKLFPGFSESTYHEFFSKVISSSGEPLSLGERQRVQFLRTMLQKPRVIILDEALSGIEESLELMIVRKLIADKEIDIVIYAGHRINIIEAFPEKINFC